MLGVWGVKLRTSGLKNSQKTIKTIVEELTVTAKHTRGKLTASGLTGKGSFSPLLASSTNDTETMQRPWAESFAAQSGLQVLDGSI